MDCRDQVSAVSVASLPTLRGFLSLCVASATGIAQTNVVDITLPRVFNLPLLFWSWWTSRSAHLCDSRTVCLDAGLPLSRFPEHLGLSRLCNLARRPRLHKRLLFSELAVHYDHRVSPRDTCTLSRCSLISFLGRDFYARKCNSSAPVILCGRISSSACLFFPV